MGLTREQKVAHRFLSAYSLLGERIESSVDCLVKAEAAKTSISASMDAISTGGASNGNRMLNAMLRMDDAIEEIERLSGSFSEQFRDVEEAVSSVQRMDPQAGRALRLVYIKGMDVGEAAEADHFSKKTVYAYLKQGLDLTYALLCQGGDAYAQPVR